MEQSGKAEVKKKQTIRRSKTKSTSGLTSTEICEIIKTAKQCGVKRLNFEDLALTFDDVPAVEFQNPVVFSENIVDNTTDEEVKDEPEILDLEELALSDPVAYEKIVHGDIDV